MGKPMKKQKTLGQIAYDSNPDDGGKSNFGPWEKAPQVVRDVHERMAKAIEREVKRRTKEEPKQKKQPTVDLSRLKSQLAQADRLQTEFRKRYSQILQDVGDTMKAERERAGVSQRKLALRIGVSHANLSLMESGRAKYTLEVCRKAIYELDGEPF